MSKYRSSYVVEIYDLETLAYDYITDLNRSKAISVAKDISQDLSKKVFISTYRSSDGQTIYYNRNGYNCVGQAW